MKTIKKFLSPLVMVAFLLTATVGVAALPVSSEKPHAFLYSQWTGQYTDLAVGSFAIKHPTSENFIGGLKSQLKSELNADFGKEALLSYARQAVVNGEVMPWSNKRMADFVRVGADYASDFALASLTETAEGFRFVQDVEVDVKTELGDRKWEIALSGIGALRETDDDIILWHLRGFAAQNRTGGGNIGVAYRRMLFGNTLAGVNTYLDYENERDLGAFWRWSFGIEAMRNDIDFSANVYRAITDDKRMTDSNGDEFITRTADGWDAKINGRLPFYAPLGFGVRYYSWDEGDGEDSSGLVYNAEWAPIPALQIGVEYDDESGGDGEVGGYFKYQHEFNTAEESFSEPLAITDGDVWNRRYETPTRRYAQQIIRQVQTQNIIIENGFIIEMQGVRLGGSVMTLNAEMMNVLTDESIAAVYTDILSTVNLVFTDATIMQSVTVGAVLIAPPSSRVSDGLYRVVESVSEANGMLMVATRQAGMAEVITEGNIRIRGNLEDFSDSGLSRFTQFQSHVPGQSSSNSFSGFCGSRGLVNHTGSDFNPFGACVGAGIPIDLEFNMSGLDSTFDFIVTPNARLAAGFDGGNSISRSSAIKLSRNPIRVNLPPVLGGFPLYFRPFLITEASASLSGTDLRAGFTGSLSRRIGARISRNGAESLTGPVQSTVNVIFPVVQVDSALSLRGRIGPEVRFTPGFNPETLESAGIRADLSANSLLSANWNIRPTPLDGDSESTCTTTDASVGVDFGLAANANFNRSFFGVDVDLRLGGNVPLPSIGLYNQRRMYGCSEEDEEPVIVSLTVSTPNLEGRSGVVRANLRWLGDDIDLDLHMVDPCGNRIFFSDKGATCRGGSGELDVDITDPGNRLASENIVWANPPDGTYRVEVDHFAGDRANSYVVTVEYGNVRRVFNGTLQVDQRRTLITFTFRNGNLI